MAAEKLHKDRYSTSVDNDLGLLCGAGGNIGQSPCRLKLDKSMWRTEKLYKATDNAGLDDLFDRRVALFRQELSKFGCGLNL